MALSHLEAEVCVIGAGPAGAALAGRLAATGYRVVVVERSRFPRPHVGESVSPGAWPLLRELGAGEAVEGAGFFRDTEARVRWGAPEVRRPAGARAGLTVDRGAFDRLLLERAREVGATVLQPAVARRPLAVAGGWEVPLAVESGPRAVRARFLADCSGRARLLGGRRRRTSPRTVALHARWRGVEAEAGCTRVEAQARSWIWGALLPGGSFRAMAFVEPELVGRRQRAGKDLEAVYRDLLAGSSLFQDLVAGGPQIEGGVSVCDATCYVDDEPVGDGWMKLGEAGFAIDPLSSSGVQAALQAGLSGAAAIGTVLSEAGDAAAAAEYFREHQRHTAERHARLSADSYRDCAEHGDKPFWRRRAPAPSSSPSLAPARLEELLPCRVRLRREVTLQPTPCVVGERVEVRRAVCHPALNRPVAFLGAYELAPLLDRLKGDRSFRDVVAGWAETVPPATAYEIAAWLARSGLLTAA